MRYAVLFGWLFLMTQFVEFEALMLCTIPVIMFWTAVTIRRTKWS